jgi:hypothetical protein
MFVLVAVSALVVGAFVAVFLAPMVLRRPRSVTMGETPKPPAQPLAQPMETVSPVPTLSPAPPTPIVAPVDSPPSSAPVVEPVPPPTADTADAKTKAQKPPHPGVPVPVPPVSVKTAPKVPESAAPPTSGVAPGLKLKTD